MCACVQVVLNVKEKHVLSCVVDGRVDNLKLVLSYRTILLILSPPLLLLLEATIVFDIYTLWYFCTNRRSST